jgi:hypothetical protein
MKSYFSNVSVDCFWKVLLPIWIHFAIWVANFLKVNVLIQVSDVLFRLNAWPNENNKYWKLSYALIIMIMRPINHNFNILFCNKLLGLLLLLLSHLNFLRITILLLLLIWVPFIIGVVLLLLLLWITLFYPILVSLWSIHFLLISSFMLDLPLCEKDFESIFTYVNVLLRMSMT